MQRFKTIEDLRGILLVTAAAIQTDKLFLSGIQKTPKAKHSDLGITRSLQDEPRQEAITVAHALNMVNCGVQKFVASNIAHHCSDWRSITSDPSILEIVLGYRIDFERLPYQASVLCIKCSEGDENIIAVEVQKLLDNIDKGVLNKTTAF